MKKILAIFLMLMLLFSSAALAENWVCPRDGSENSGNFCPQCGISHEEALKENGVHVQPGDKITFGHYTQTAEGRDITPLEWQVLAVENGKALLITYDIIDCLPYNSAYEAADWEHSLMRSLLNESFLEVAFTAAERNAIVTTEVDNSSAQGYPGYAQDAGNNTTDKVFLLSYQEAWTYFADNAARKCVPTGFAITRGANFYNGTNEDYLLDRSGCGWWWLRSPGIDTRYAMYVRYDGNRSSNRVDGTIIGLRPALWIDLNSL